MASSSISSGKRLPIILGLVYLGFFLLGFAFPDSWWGTHYLAFLPGPWAYVFIFLTAGLILAPAFLPTGFLRSARWPKASTYQLLSAGAALLTGVLFYRLRIVDDNYGNATYLNSFLDEPVKRLSDGAWGNLFSIQFYPGQGRDAVLQVANLLAYNLGTTLREAYGLLAALSGASFVWLWLSAIPRHVSHGPGRSALLIAVLSTPLVLVFFGHTESYPLLFALHSAWMVLLLRYLRQGTLLQYLGLWAVLLLCIRFHTLSLLLLPAMIGASLFQFARTHPLTKKILTPKGILLYLFLPLTALGAILYFTVLQENAQPRTVIDLPDELRLFLPLSSSEPHTSRYDLFSGNHFFDYFNMLLFWAPAALILLLGSWTSFRLSLRKFNPELALPLISFLLLAGVLFLVNPLFSMPMDFDLFCLPVPALLAVLFASARDWEAGPVRPLVYPALGLALMTIPIVAVNTSKIPHAERLERVAVYVFKTYYLHSDRILLYALNKIYPELEVYLAKGQEFLSKTRPYAIPGNDPKYRDLLIDRALTQMTVQKDRLAARATFLEAEAYGTLPDDFALELLEIHFELKEYKQAHERALDLIARGFPNGPQSLRIGIHTALEAELYDRALGHSREYLALEPGDSMVVKIAERLQNNQAVDSLKYFFARQP